METKNFLGLDGLKRFWEKAKTWIVNEITSKIAEIVADAPESFDTLKEISDWISTHEDSASAMNSKIIKNQSDINELNNKLSSIEQTNFKAIFDFIYPVGCLYWSNSDTNPSKLFGGTWVQIKDRFVLACGDTYKTVGATGGASSVTLSISNMPSHTHSFTPSGTVSSTFTGSQVTTSEDGAHTHTTNSTSKNLIGNYDPDKKVGAYRGDGDISNNDGICSKTSSSSTGCGHSFRIAGASGSSYSLHIDATHSHGTDSKGGHRHTLTTNGTVSSSFSGTSSSTSPSGSGTAFSILPPYVVKYCWERTA